MKLYYSLVDSHINHSIVIYDGASERDIKPIRVVGMMMILYVNQDDHNIPEIGTHDLHIWNILSVLKFHEVYNYNFLKFVRFAMNDKPKLFEEFDEPHLSLQYYHARG